MGRRSSPSLPGQGTLSFEGGDDPFASDPGAGAAGEGSSAARKSPVPPAATRRTSAPPPSSRPLPSAPPLHSGADSDFSLHDPEVLRATFGMGIRDLLGPEQLVRGNDPTDLFRGAEAHAREQVEREHTYREPLRKLLRDELAAVKNPPPYAGLHQVSAADLERVARSHLYNGLTEAVHADVVMHETIPLSIGQLGICVVGYDGRHDQWRQQIRRQELVLRLPDPVAEVQAVLEMRDGWQRRGGPNPLSELARRGFASYRAREAMLNECEGRWKMGFGMPAPLELLTGMGCLDLLEMGLDLLRRLLLGETRWLFVSGASAEPGLEMLGGALHELEFAVLMRLHTRLREQVRVGRYPERLRQIVEAFVEEVGPKLVLGVYRAGALSPPRFFVAHEEQVYPAALIAMADALAVQPHGFPALVQLARSQCRVLLGGGDFEQVVQQAYRAAGAPEWFHRGEIR